MKVLVVDDDENKRQRIISHLLKIDPSMDISESASYQSGLKTIMDNTFDLVLLDMTMPTFDISPDEDGGRPQPFAGRRILQQMVRRELNIPVIVVTQYDSFGEGAKTKTLSELDTELRNECPMIYEGSIYYHATQDEWQLKLNKLFQSISKKRS